MERANENKQTVYIPENTDLNLLVTSPFKISTPVLREDLNLKGKALERYVFESVLKCLKQVDFDAYGSEGEVIDVIKRLKELTDENRVKLIKASKNQILTEEEKIVITMEYFKHLSDENGLGFARDNDDYLFFNGSYWQTCKQKSFMSFLGQVAEKVGIPLLKARQPKTREKLLQQFNTTFQFFEDKGDDSEIKINLANGTFCFNGGEHSEESEPGRLKKFDKEHLLKYQLPFIYDPNAKAPQFEFFLNRVLPDRDSQKILFEYLGYIFTSMKLEKVLILHGDGANGKSVVFDIVTALLGPDNVSSHSMDRLVDSSGYYRAKLNTKLLNYSSELGTLKDIEMFKRLASGEPITARLPYGEPIELTEYCRFMFNANTLPLVEQTHAFFRRQLILSFTQTISEEERDINLAKKIISSELGGIFNLVLEGLKRLVNQGSFTKSKVVDDNLASYKKDSNTVQLFLEDESWIKSLTKKIRLKDLYQDYRTYCGESGYHSVSLKKFAERLRALNYTVKAKEAQNSTNVYCEKSPAVGSFNDSDHDIIKKLFFKN